MRNSPSKKALQEARKVHAIPLHLVQNPTRADLSDLMDKFDERSEAYVQNPSLDRLVEMAEAVLPISKSTADMYCRIVLEKYPFHKRAKEIIENF